MTQKEAAEAQQRASLRETMKVALTVLAALEREEHPLARDASIAANGLRFALDIKADD